MKVRLLLCVVFAALAGCAVAPSPPASCGEPLLQVAESARELRNIAKLCPTDTQAQAQALLRLNALPPTPSKHVAPGQQNLSGRMERVTWEVDLYFYVLEAYPPEEALAKLEELVGRAAATHKIESLRVVGSSEPLEGEPVARARAAFVRDYFVQAGLASALIELSDNSVPNAQSPESRAAARSVKVRLVAVRQQPSTR